ncbi:MAG TPA: hypothetical protein PKL96_02510 [Bacteroidales bacterium]|nr:hypothetical protein [Bacteroidales bacterium]HPS26849.1 hypothetical protein [Bacteroidales bacterium]
MELTEISELGERVKNWRSAETSYFRTLPVKNYLFSLMAVLGITATCLPWADVTVGFYNQAMAVGLHFFAGWIIFLVYLAVVVMMLFNKHLKVENKLVEKAPLYAGAVTSALTLFFLIGKLFKVRYGVYLCLGVSLVFLFLVWYFNYRNKGGRFDKLIN